MKIWQRGLSNNFTLLFSFFIPLLFSGLLAGCEESKQIQQPIKTVPHESSWGIYVLDLQSQDVTLVYSFPAETYPSGLRLSQKADRIAFAQKPDSSDDTGTEIYMMKIDGKDLKKITQNSYWDLYPAWSPDDTKIAFLSKRGKDLDIYLMDTEGANDKKLYDSGDNDADIDWAGNHIIFTSGFAIWRMNQDGTQPVQISFPQEKGLWGQANLPVGDYDPRFSPDGSKIAFERLVNINDPHGGYDIFVINQDGSAEARLTSSGYSQGLVNWSHSGKELVYTVAAINGQGKYDIYVMNSDGTNVHNITPSYFPPDFLCHYPAFNRDDNKIYFLGQWWEEN